MSVARLKLVKRATGGRPAKISSEQILEVARQLGAGQFTFNNIAEKLGVKTTALYYHFDSRDALLTALSLELAKEFDIKAGNPKRWKPWLEETVLRFYDFLLANPALFEVGNWRGFASFGQPIVERVLETLEAAGYSLKESGRIWEITSHVAYSEARLLNEMRRAGPLLAVTTASQKPKLATPRADAMAAGLTLQPREQLAETLHWLIAALPRPRR
ncbi:MAG: TetR/AcrR family transcriptional regulator [Pseudomonadota bacterium]